MGLIEKYRPQKFSEFWGNDIAITALKKMLARKDRFHSYLICGDFGIGKTSLARLIAKAINCEQFDGEEICNQCIGCNFITSNDVIEIDAATYRGIGEIRRVKEFAVLKPIELKNKVIIFDEAHQLTDEAVSSLLKIVEEPPEFTYFIFVTTESDKIKPTLKSRLFIVELLPPTSKTIRDFSMYICEREGIEYKDDFPFISFRDFLKFLEGSSTVKPQNYNPKVIFKSFLANREMLNQELKIALELGIYPHIILLDFIDECLENLKDPSVKIRDFLLILLNIHNKMNEIFRDQNKRTLYRIFNMLFIIFHAAENWNGL